MSTTETAEHAPSVIPAQLSFIAIYNPSLGNSDESLKDQIVFYSSKTTRARKGRKNDEARSSDAENEEENEKLRQVGLAQGMVDFAKWVLYSIELCAQTLQALLISEKELCGWKTRRINRDREVENRIT